MTAGNPIGSVATWLWLTVKKVSGPKLLAGLARYGYTAQGFTYLVVGSLAAASAQDESRPPSLGGVFSAIDGLPAGWILLLAIAVGLCAYAGWKLMQALLDLKGFGWNAKGLLQRTGMLVDVLLYAGLGGLAVISIVSGSRAGRDEIEDEAPFIVARTAAALDWPLGHWFVGLVGLGAIAMGLNQLAKARHTAFEDIRAGGWAMTAIHIIGRVGFLAKGTIFAATGVLFLMAAWQAEAATAGGLRAALQALAAVPLGNSVLVAISAGLALYGIFGILKGFLHKPVVKVSPLRDHQS